MPCPLCSARKARRACPALGRAICPICCGTKRQVDIRCPATCQYLGVARAHPPAAVKRQFERDIQALLPALQTLDKDAADLFLALLALTGSRPIDPLISPTDIDAADAAGSLAATMETAARGVIYEHRPASLAAQRLAADFRHLLEEFARQAPAGFEGRAASALRAVERCARDAGRPGSADTAFLEIARRTAARLRAESAAAQPSAGEGGSAPGGLVLP